MTTSSIRLDQRLLNAGMAATAPDLIAVWADHSPATLPIPATCPTCGHTYRSTAPLCPSAAVVRPLLRRRRPGLDPALFEGLTDNQWQDLTGKHLSTAVPAEAIR